MLPGTLFNHWLCLSALLLHCFLLRQSNTLQVYDLGYSLLRNMVRHQWTCVCRLKKKVTGKPSGRHSFNNTSFHNHHSSFQITSLLTCETPSTLTSMSRNTSSPPSSACCCLESFTAGCVGSSCTLSRQPHSKAISLSSRPCPGKASMSWRPTTHRSPIWISARLP